VLSVRDQDQLRPLRDMYVRQVSKANIGEQCPPLLCCLAILLEGPSRHRSVSSLESRVAWQHECSCYLADDARPDK
jgi:hypothetical protein